MCTLIKQAVLANQSARYMETLLKLIIDYASSKQNYNNAFQTYARNRTTELVMRPQFTRLTGRISNYNVAAPLFYIGTASNNRLRFIKTKL